MAHLFILSGDIPPFFLSSILDTYQPGGLIFRCHLLAFSHCSWYSGGKNTGVVCHPSKDMRADSPCIQCLLTSAVLSHSVNCYLKETSKYTGLNKTGIYFCFPFLSQDRWASAGSVTLHPNARIPFLGSRNASVAIISQPAGAGKGSKEGLHFSSLEKKCQMAILHNERGWEILSLCDHVVN